MYSNNILSAEINCLVTAMRPFLCGPVIRYGTIVNNDFTITIFITYNNPKYGAISPRFKINTNGDVYEPLFYGRQLSIIFDWLNRIGYNIDRCLERTAIYKKELMGRTFLIEAP